MPLEDAWSLQDVSNPKLTMRSELERIGYLGDIKCSHKHNSLAAHFELHIGRPNCFVFSWFCTTNTFPCLQSRVRY